MAHAIKTSGDARAESPAIASLRINGRDVPPGDYRAKRDGDTLTIVVRHGADFTTIEVKER